MKSTISTPLLGPVIMGTLVTANLQEVVDAYVNYLHLHVIETGHLKKALVSMWQTPAIEGNPYSILANAFGEPWLRIIEDTSCTKTEGLKHAGWISLEVLVDDVDTLAASLIGSSFKVLRPVANLDMSDKIRAVQIEGPAGEVLYLTQIKEQVPPFELPIARCAVDHLFIPILCSHDRRASLSFYQKLADWEGLSFETKITVINQAYGYDLSKKHPVATLQLAGKTLIEIDEIPAASARPHQDGHLASGIAMITFGVQKMHEMPLKMHHIKSAFYGNKHASCIKGPTGELVELIDV